jgi:hypothetical protein
MWGRTSISDRATIFGTSRVNQLKACLNHEAQPFSDALKNEAQEQEVHSSSSIPAEPVHELPSFQNPSQGQSLSQKAVNKPRERQAPAWQLLLP